MVAGERVMNDDLTRYAVRVMIITLALGVALAVQSARVLQLQWQIHELKQAK